MFFFTKTLLLPFFIVFIDLEQLLVLSRFLRLNKVCDIMHFPVTVMPLLHFALKNSNHRSFFHLITVSIFSLFHQLKLSSDTPYAAISVFLIFHHLHSFRFILTIVALQLLSFLYESSRKLST